MLCIRSVTASGLRQLGVWAVSAQQCIQHDAIGFATATSHEELQQAVTGGLPLLLQQSGGSTHLPLQRHVPSTSTVPTSAAAPSYCQTRGLFGGRGEPKKYSQRRLVGWSPEQLFTVISEVEHYCEFVPWCIKSRIISNDPDKGIEAELEVGFQLLHERYTSHVTLHRPNLVTSSVSKSSLFDHLDNTWRMEPGPTPRSCWLSFDVDFAFRSPLYARAADMFFSEVVKNMTGAFETRCAVLYGPSSFVQPKK